MIIEIEESVEKTVNRVNKGNWKIIVKEREKKSKEKRRVRKCTVIKDRLSSGLPEVILIKCQELSECTVIGGGSDPIG